MLKIGIIDSGVRKSLLPAGAENMSGLALYRHANGAIVMEEEIDDQLMHGTVCAYVYLAAFPGASLFVVKIFNEEPVTDEGVLTAAIQACLDAGVDLMNMSVGVESEYMSPELATVCQLAYDRNIPIVAAAHLDDKQSFPAFHPAVISVGCMDLRAEADLLHVREHPVTFYTKGIVQFAGREYFGTSFACPLLGVRLLRIMEASPYQSIAQWLQRLIQSAVTAGFPLPLPAPVNLYNPALLDGLKEQYFNENKHWEHLGRITLVPLFDTIMWQVATVCKQFALMPVYDHGYYPHHIPKFPVEQADMMQFDTLAVGSLHSVLSFYNYPAITAQLKQLLLQQKNFIVFHEADAVLLKQLAHQCKSDANIVLLGHPTAIVQDFTQLQFLQPVQVPVVLIVSARGAATLPLQCSMTAILQQAGYQPATLATSVQAILTGVDFYLTTPTTLLQPSLRALQYFRDPGMLLVSIQQPMLQQQALDPHAYAMLHGIQPDLILITEDDVQFFPQMEVLATQLTAFFPGVKMARVFEERPAAGVLKEGVLILQDAGFAEACLQLLLSVFAAPVCNEPI
ncbi:hypothetical protein LX64_00974 [Chitinophaga skermanii]|uniref:Peptidase S8/S53 domain-containing protein n=1 Tax=Chitinophaga skermanii TaxID=331697 RepID=A0A327QUH0_9BACT|nr:S8 family serine peptidase [Chitinophaga skermanii]RAJ08326.1 hypothetical protein LX64_00974 [Chitinophaga skermanii]